MCPFAPGMIFVPASKRKADIPYDIMANKAKEWQLTGESSKCGATLKGETRWIFYFNWLDFFSKNNINVQAVEIGGCKNKPEPKKLTGIIKFSSVLPEFDSDAGWNFFEFCNSAWTELSLTIFLSLPPSLKLSPDELPPMSSPLSESLPDPPTGEIETETNFLVRFQCSSDRLISIVRFYFSEQKLHQLNAHP